jgi:hypothetical protein
VSKSPTAPVWRRVRCHHACPRALVCSRRSTRAVYYTILYYTMLCYAMLPKHSVHYSTVQMHGAWVARLALGAPGHGYEHVLLNPLACRPWMDPASPTRRSCNRPADAAGARERGVCALRSWCFTVQRRPCYVRAIGVPWQRDNVIATVSLSLFSHSCWNGKMARGSATQSDTILSRPS